MLTENQVKEHLSIAYLKAVAAICNFGIETSTIDYDSVDATITCNNAFPLTINRSPNIKVQLKATESLRMISDSHYSFNLPLKNYDDLRLGSAVPRILVVLSLPFGKINWLSHSNTDLILRNCAYWVSLLGQPETKNSTSVTVHVPVGNIFSPNTLQHLMERASRMEEI